MNGSTDGNQGHTFSETSQQEKVQETRILRSLQIVKKSFQWQAPTVGPCISLPCK